MNEQAEYHRRWRQANREKLRDYKRRWVEANREKVRDSMRRYYEAHREKEIDRMRQWQKANKDKVYKSQLKWRKANKDKISEYSRRNYIKRKLGERFNWDDAADMIRNTPGGVTVSQLPYPKQRVFESMARRGIISIRNGKAEHTPILFALQECGI